MSCVLVAICSSKTFYTARVNVIYTSEIYTFASSCVNLSDDQLLVWGNACIAGPLLQSLSFKNGGEAYVYCKEDSCTRSMLTKSCSYRWSNKPSTNHNDIEVIRGAFRDVSDSEYSRSFVQPTENLHRLLWSCQEYSWKRIYVIWWSSRWVTLSRCPSSCYTLQEKILERVPKGVNTKGRDASRPSSIWQSASNECLCAMEIGNHYIAFTVSPLWRSNHADEGGTNVTRY